MFNRILIQLSRPILLAGVIGGMAIHNQQLLLMQSSYQRYNDQLNTTFQRSLNPNDEFYKNTILLSGTANPQLANQIAQYLNCKLGNVQHGRFADGECQIQVQDNIRGKDIFIIQPTSPPVNDSLIELLLLVSALRRASAKSIIAVIPYYGYSRQDRKTPADVARLIETIGVDRIISVDLHSGQIQGFFGPRVPVDNLESNLAAINYINLQKQFNFRDVAIVSPDAAGVGRAKKFQELFQQSNSDIDISLAIIVNQRESNGKISKVNLVGHVKGKDCFIVDDMIDSAVTMSEASKELKRMGAKRVFAFATHGLFAGNAFQNIKNSELEQVIVTDSVPAQEQEKELGDRICRLSVAPLLAEAIYRIYKRESVNNLFHSHKKL